VDIVSKIKARRKYEIINKIIKNVIIFINIFVYNRFNMTMELDEGIEEIKNEHEKEEEEQRERLEEEDE
jgi:hypothetical protein